MSIDLDTISLKPIGYVRTCFPEKFGIPRQPALAPSAKGILVLDAAYNDVDMIEGLSLCSHIWLTFIFHEHLQKGWKKKVRPPRLGGNKKMGVFATRSPFRPNPIGLSAVALERIEDTERQLLLHLSGVDLVDGTPVLDIKPYVPYTDLIPDANNAFANEQPDIVTIHFSEKAEEKIGAIALDLDKRSAEIFKLLITEVLQQNPKPAYHNVDPQRDYKMALLPKVSTDSGAGINSTTNSASLVTIVWRCRVSEINGEPEIDVLDIIE